MKSGLSNGLLSRPTVLALSPLLMHVVRRIAEWVAEPTVSAAKQRLVGVLKDEILAASRVELHLPVPLDPALRRLAEKLALGSEDGRTLATLAHDSGLSQRSLFRNFQQETGMSPGQWRRQAQVLRSLELLAEGRSVTQTSLEVGCESTGAFIRAFRQVVGDTPAVYAKQQRLGSGPTSRMQAPDKSSNRRRHQPSRSPAPARAR